MITPRERAARAEANAQVPGGAGDRFSGYGVMGMPFVSGHILGLRSFPASSVGPGYRAIWHRDPAGVWTFYQDQSAELACTRYFSSAVENVVEAPIEIEWTSETTFDVRAKDLQWTITLGSTPVTRVMNVLGARMPARAWRSKRVLSVMSRVAGPALKIGDINLTGVAPNGQEFIANPIEMWIASSPRATVDGEDLGPVGPVPIQARLADFAIPQRGMFVFGRSIFN